MTVASELLVSPLDGFCCLLFKKRPTESRAHQCSLLTVLFPSSLLNEEEEKKTVRYERYGSKVRNYK